MKISPARAAAFDALLRVERDGAFATDALDALLRREEAKQRDAALATELVLGVLRWRRLLDFLIERFISRRVESLDLEVLLALRLGLYQLRYLSRVPASAAVNESAELVKRARKSSAAALVNAALRRAAGHKTLRHPGERFVPPEISLAERLALAFSHPTWLVERWLVQFGEAETRALLEANNRPPRVTAALLETAEAWHSAATFEQHGYRPSPGRWLKSAVELHAIRGSGSRRNAAQPVPARAQWFIQDEASQMIPFLLDVHPGHRVLDLCAAPGGKTARLVQQKGARRGIVVACDVHLHRLRQMREFLGSLSLNNVQYLALDGTRPLPLEMKFDRILVDAPCSGTGTLARNPEIRWRLTPKDLAALAEKQRALLHHALERLAPGGRLVYSTCSLEPEENEDVVASAISAHPGAGIVRCEATLAPHLQRPAKADELFDSQGYFRTLPSVHGTDGFFAAVVGAS